MTALDLSGVTRRYGDTTALDDVSLTIDDGEFFTLVGPSGCGKTTTLRLVAGFESPTAGEIRFDGRDVSGVPPEARGIGVVFQSYALFPHLSVTENVAYGLRFSDPPGGVSKHERVEELLSLVDLVGFGERDPTELSGGQQQRVALARALAPGPRILLLDEPMSALDAGLRERLRAQVKQIQRELGVTTLYVTHDQEEALAVSDRVAVMNDGRVEQVGTPREVYHRPETPFVASFVGDNNLFEGRVVDAGAGVAAVDVAGTVFRVAVAEPTPKPGTTLTFAVRPEKLRLVPEVDASADVETTREAPTADVENEDGDWDRSESNRLHATVKRTEFLGETTRVWLDWNGQEVTARATKSLDERATLTFEPGDAHVLRGGR